AGSRRLASFVQGSALWCRAILPAAAARRCAPDAPENSAQRKRTPRARARRPQASVSRSLLECCNAQFTYWGTRHTMAARSFHGRGAAKVSLPHVLSAFAVSAPLAAVSPAWGQADGNGKAMVDAKCNTCHPLAARTGSGYTP